MKAANQKESSSRSRLGLQDEDVQVAHQILNEISSIQEHKNDRITLQTLSDALFSKILAL